MEKKNERAPQMGFPQMTLRDYFAAKAMAVMATGAMREGNVHVHLEDLQQLADNSYEMADAMLSAREK
mgnify:FL=1|jgi:hypothetical protein